MFRTYIFRGIASFLFAQNKSLRMSRSRTTIFRQRSATPFTLKVTCRERFLSELLCAGMRRHSPLVRAAETVWRMGFKYKYESITSSLLHNILLQFLSCCSCVPDARCVQYTNVSLNTGLVDASKRPCRFLRSYIN